MKSQAFPAVRHCAKAKKLHLFFLMALLVLFDIVVMDMMIYSHYTLHKPMHAYNQTSVFTMALSLDNLLLSTLCTLVQAKFALALKGLLSLPCKNISF